MGMIVGMHYTLLLAVLYGWVSPSVSSSCSNLSPCNAKGGTCIAGNHNCNGQEYTSVRHCAGAGCKCCVGDPTPPLNSALCSNLSPCDEKRGICIPGDYSCHDLAYITPRFCEGTGCKCCKGGSYHSPDGHKQSYHSPDGHECRPGQSCGRRGQCERGSCPSGYEKHAGDCEGGDCECCARKDGVLKTKSEHHVHRSCRAGRSCGRRGRCERGSCPYGYMKHAGDCGGRDCECCVRRDEHHNDRCNSKSCGIRGTCRGKCWSDEELHSGSCGSNCMCCTKTNRSSKTNSQWIDVIHGGNCGGSCGRHKVCRLYNCLSDEIQHGSCTSSHHCKCCEKRKVQMCKGFSCNNGQGTCHERHCPHGKLYIGHCSGHNCVCCANIVGCPVSGSRCSGNGYCRQGSCFVNEYQIGSCGGISSCACCVKNQFPACFALGGSCLGSGFCRAGACIANEIQTGTCSGADCVCCTPYAQQVCTNVNGPCNNGAGTCRSLCLPGETDMGLGSCRGSACRCCKFTVCPAATCIRGPMQGSCRPNSCQHLEFDIGECITGQPNCRCCTQSLVTCPYFGAKCGQIGTCRSGGCLREELPHSGQCGGGFCVCCASIPASKVVCPTLNSRCGRSGICRAGGCLGGEAYHSGDCGSGGNCACCAAATTAVVACSTLNAVCGQSGICRAGSCLDGEAVHSGDCGGGGSCVCCATVPTPVVTCQVGAVCGESGTCRIGGCLAGEALHSGDCGGGNCFCCATITITSAKVKREAVFEDLVNVTLAGDTTVKTEAASPDINYEQDAVNNYPLAQATYVDECKKENFTNIIKLICTRKQLSRRSGKSINLEYIEVNEFYSSEEYGEYMEDNSFYGNMYDSIETSHDEDFGREGMEFYDSIEENMFKEKYLNDLHLDLEDEFISASKIDPPIKDKQEPKEAH